jgi:O-acetyl-ADP-ribose deacetylase (regulator of RNase III)
MDVGKTRIILKQVDITREEVDVIVNAANSGLRGGGGVDGAIHRAGGPGIMAECRLIRERQGGCPTGEAVITTAGDLPASHVVHAVGPVWRGGGQGEAEQLRSAYQRSLELAASSKAKTIAFPAISTGVYGYPVDRAAAVALDTAMAFARGNDQFREIRFLLFSAGDLEIYSSVLARLEASQGG